MFKTETLEEIPMADWNPLILALIHGKSEIYEYITEKVDFNLKQLLVFPNCESEEAGIAKTLKILINEEQSKSFDWVLNQMSHYVPLKVMKEVIGHVFTKQWQWGLDILFHSQLFMKLYYDSVRNLSTDKKSFSEFYDKHFSSAFQDLEVFPNLSQAPFGLGFGVYLIREYKEFANKQISSNADFKKLVETCTKAITPAETARLRPQILLIKELQKVVA